MNRETQGATMEREEASIIMDGDRFGFLGRMLRGRVTKLGALLSAVAVLVAACGSSAPSSSAASKSATKVTTTVTFSLLSGALLDFLPQFAQAQGFFKQNHINVDFVFSNNGPGLSTALASGSANFGSASPPLIFPAMAKGVPIEFLTANDGYTYNLVAKAGTPLPGNTWQQRLKDLTGKTVGVTALGSLFQEFTQRLMAKAGMAPNAITFIAVGGDTTAIPALEHGKVSAIVTSAPYQQIMGKSNFEYVVDNVQHPTGVTTGGLVDGYASLRPYVSSHKATVDAVCRALWQASNYVHNPSNLTTVAKFIAKNQNLTLAQAESVWKEYGLTYSLKLTPSIWSLQPSFLPSTEHVPSFPYSKYVYSPCATGSVLNK